VQPVQDTTLEHTEWTACHTAEVQWY